MRISTDRILTTHVGSLPRPDDLIELVERTGYTAALPAPPSEPAAGAGPTGEGHNETAALRQRLLSEAALRLGNGDKAPLVVTLPTVWRGEDAAAFFAAATLSARLAPKLGSRLVLLGVGCRIGGLLTVLLIVHFGGDRVSGLLLAPGLALQGFGSGSISAPLIAFVLIGADQNFPFGGTSILIMVGVALDTVKQIESQLQQRNYEGFLR